ncbi:hypothetical protein [Mycoplasma sp. P36-A1]|uniref:hypothetical protein n=1 Tax=Mycoplasma sp. P36-A1 TaxID=3252900 RepID=UPI003C2EFDC9
MIYIKVSKNQKLRLLASLYENDPNIIECLIILKSLEIIDDKLLNKIKLELEIESNFKVVLLAFKIDEKLISKIIFLSKYHTLDNAIVIALDYEEYMKKIKKEIVSSLIYPLILIISTLITIQFIIQGILPKISIINPKAFEEYSFLINVIETIPIISLAIIITCIVVVINYIFLKYKNPNLLLKIIKSNMFTLKIQASLFTYNIATMLNEMLVHDDLSENVLYQCKEYNSNVLSKIIINNILLDLEKGLELNVIIKDCIFITNDYKNIMYMSNDSDKLNSLSKQFIQFKTEKYQQNLKRSISIFVPLIILLCSVIVILLYILIMIPALNFEI